MMALAALLLAGCGGASQSPDPAAADYPIAYVKRPLPLDAQGQPADVDLRDLDAFNAGADLYLRDRALPSAQETNLTAAITGGQGDVKDLSVSFDGNKLIFAMRKPQLAGVAAADQPTWNIWEYDIPSGQLHRIISSDIVAEEGQDVAPQYLRDGRIVFTSTRQRQTMAMLLDEGKPQYAGLVEDRSGPAFVLHVMNADGSGIEQISFNQSHDRDPTVLRSGKILFSRWDNAGNGSGMHFYKVNPDGTGLQMVYGINSHDTGTNGSTIQFMRPRQMDNGKILSIIRPMIARLGGDLITVDVDNYSDNTQPLVTGMGGTAQAPATQYDIHTDGTISPGGRFSAAYPLWDGTGRMLVSWSPCRVEESGRILPCSTERLTAANVVEAAPLYGLYAYDPSQDTQLPVVVPREGWVYTDIVAAAPRSGDYFVNNDIDAALAAENMGMLHIRSVYDVDGSFNALGGTQTTFDQMSGAAPDDRVARFLRITKPVPMPSGVPAFADGANNRMIDILGYTAIEPDGSVLVKVPANVPLSVSVLDKDGRKLSIRDGNNRTQWLEHDNWLQVKPGETVECHGCHDRASTVPHGRPGAVTPLNSGAATDGPFTGTDSAMVAGMGETMAQTRARLTCPLSAYAGCTAIQPSVDVVFDDVWSPTKAPSFSYRYADLGTAPPTSSACIASWSPQCRITINYIDNIEPLWALARTFDINGTPLNGTCLTCHYTSDSMGLIDPDVRAQLNLGDEAEVDDAPQNPSTLNSYRELINPDFVQVINAGMTGVTNQLVTCPNDPQSLCPVRVAGGVRMTAGRAAASRVLPLFATNGSHAGRLSTAELRLISEWLDIGGQYFNNPCDSRLSNNTCQ